MEHLSLLFHLHSVLFHAVFSALKLRRNIPVTNGGKTRFSIKYVPKRAYFNVIQEEANEKERRKEINLKMCIHNVLSVWCKTTYVAYDLHHTYVPRDCI